MAVTNQERAANFGAVLAAARQASHLTQEALAERARIGLRTVQALECDAARPRRETLRRLSEALEVPVEDWLPYAHVRRARRPAAPFSNLASPRTSLVGREHELADGLERLGSARLLTLTGPGGVGKTRLGAELASRAAADRVCWVELNGPAASKPLAALALALHIRPPVGDDLLTHLVAALAPSELPLVVFDGCEHALDACAAAAGALLDACPALRLVCTTRAPLRIYGEAILAVGPLPLPTTDTAEAVDASAATRLFFERARLVCPTLEATPETRRLVAHICHRLDGLPLSIELAAAATAELPLATLAERVLGGEALSFQGWRDSPRHQRTLREVLAWSHELLDPREQKLLRRLAVFAGTFAADAAAEIADDDASTAGHLRRLVDASLVVAVEPGDRFRLLDTVRDYALELLRAAGEEAYVRQRHLAFYAAQSARATPLLQGAEQQRWVRWLDADLPDILAAADWSAAPWAPGEPVREQRLALGLPMLSQIWRYWFLSGSCAVGYGRLLELLDLTGSQSWSDTMRRARASGLGGACVLAMHLGDPGAALALGEESHALQDDDGHDDRADCVALALGMIRSARGEHRLALLLLEESLRDGLSRSDDEVIAFSSLYLGQALAAVGRRPEAMARTSAAVAVFERAAGLLEESIVLFRAHGDRGWHAQALADLARTRHLRGELTTARALYEQSEQLAEDVGYRDRAAERTRFRALLEFDTGDLETAVATWTRGLDEALAANQTPYVADHLDTAASWLGAADGPPADIVCLLGAASAIRRERGVVPAPDERPAAGRAFSLARSRLGWAAAAVTWRAGRACDGDDAVARARLLLKVWSGAG
jgi:predicted ATPase/DNA-binding XRE family transcriptional regulator